MIVCVRVASNIYIVSRPKKQFINECGQVVACGVPVPLSADEFRAQVKAIDGLCFEANKVVCACETTTSTFLLSTYDASQ